MKRGEGVDVFGKKKKDTVQLTIHPILGKMKYLGIGWELSEDSLDFLLGSGSSLFKKELYEK
jgi:glutamine cyclotransferase